MGREWQHKEKGATRHLDNSLILLVPPARFERAAHGLGKCRNHALNKQYNIGRTKKVKEYKKEDLIYFF